MSHFCLHNLTLLDSVSGVPICVFVGVSVCVCAEGGVRKREVRARKKERESERDPRRTGFLQGLWLFLHHYPDCRQSLLMSLSLPSLSIHSLTHTHRHTHTHAVYCVLYVSTEAEGVLHRGEKRKYGRGGEGGDAENGE